MKKIKLTRLIDGKKAVDFFDTSAPFFDKKNYEREMSETENDSGIYVSEDGNWKYDDNKKMVYINEGDHDLFRDLGLDATDPREWELIRK